LLGVALVVVNGAAAFLLPEQFDLTRKGAFSLSPQTVNLLARWTRPVEILLLAPSESKTAADREFAQAAPVLRDLLELYRARQPAIGVRMLDPQSSAEARQILAESPDITPPCVVVKWAKGEPSGHEVLHARDLVELHAEPGSISSVDFLGEQALTAA